MIPILFGKNSQYTKLHIKTKQPYMWENGTYRLNKYEGGELRVLRKPGGASQLETAFLHGGVRTYKEIKQFDSLEEATGETAKENTKRETKPKPDKVFALRLCDYASDFKRKEGDKACRSYNDMLKKTMEELKKLTLDRLKSKLGDGYNEGFMHFDGSVDLGYRLEQIPNGGWRQLDISLVHLYVGK